MSTSKRRRLLLLFCFVYLFPATLFQICIDYYHLDCGALASSSALHESATIVKEPEETLYKRLQVSAPGASKRQLIASFGPPTYKESNLSFTGCPAVLSNADEIWFYQIGYGGTAMLPFKDDICSGVPELSDEDRYRYEKWKTKQIQQLAPGQSEADLKLWLGDCFHYCPTYFPFVRTRSGVKWAPLAPNNHKYGDFFISSNFAIRLQMQKGRCVRTEASGVFW